MRLGFHNTLTATLVTLLAHVFFSSVVRAEDMESFVKNSAGKGMILAIAAVNKAMRDAAENPMDQWRRDNVRRAISMLPAAITALGQQYQQVALNPYDFPKIQAMMGGFVDVNAPDNYKKFLVNPDKRLIPKVGPGFPEKAMHEAEQQVNFAGPAGRGGVPLAPKFTKTDDSAKLGLKDAAPGGDDPASVISAPAPPEKGKKDTKSIGYDDDAAKNPAASGSTTTANGGSVVVSGNAAPAPASVTNTGGRVTAYSAGTAGGGVGSLSEFKRELSNIEQDQAHDNIFTEGFFDNKPRKADTTDEKSKDKDSDKAKDNDKSKSRLRSSLENSDHYHLKIKPKYWRVTPLVRLVERCFVGEAHAEGGGGGGGGGDQDKQNAGQVVAQILFGVAAIIAAIAPMVVAGIQAKADVKIAEINAETQKTLTQITADTSKYLADQQKDIALTQSQIAQQISQQNNAGVTQRLDMQLAELRSARQDAQAAEEEKRQLDFQYQQERIDLAQKQANDNLSLAKQTLNAQLTQAGLSQGFSNSTNSGDRLGVTRGGLVTGASGGGGPPPGGGGAEAGGGRAFELGGNGNGGSGSGQNRVMVDDNGPGGPGSGTAPGSANSPLAQAGGISLASAAGPLGGAQVHNASVVTSASSALLKSVGDDGQPEIEEVMVNGKLQKRVKKHGTSQGLRGRGVLVSSDGVVHTIGRTVSEQMRTALVGNPLKSGSSPVNRAYIGGSSTTGKSATLGGYIGGSTTSGATFAGYRDNQAQQPPAQQTQSSVVQNTEQRRIRQVGGLYEETPQGSYNAPKEEDSGHKNPFEGFNFPGLEGFGGN